MKVWLACWAILALTPVAALADVPVTLNFFYADAADNPDRPSPDVKVQASNLLTGADLVVDLSQDPEQNRARALLTLSDADFQGPYARVRLAVTDLRLPEGDAKADVDIQFAFELVLRRAQLADAVEIDVPVITSSRKTVVKGMMAMPELDEELPARLFMAQQWMSVYQASPEAVADAPKSFALQRLIARGMVDFSVSIADARRTGVLVVPSPEMQRSLSLYWASQKTGLTQHLDAYYRARLGLWMDLTEVEDILRKARNIRLETAARCAEAKEMVSFFENYTPEDDAIPHADRLFRKAGTLEGYVKGRRLDIKFACERMQL